VARPASGSVTVDQATYTSLSAPRGDSATAAAINTIAAAAFIFTHLAGREYGGGAHAHP